MINLRLTNKEARVLKNLARETQLKLTRAILFNKEEQREYQLAMFLQQEIEHQLSNESGNGTSGETRKKKDVS